MVADVLIVGAGPAGLIAARKIASDGFSVIVHEEHPSIGVPNHCAGLISIEGLERLGVKPSPDFILNEIFGGRVYAPNGRCIEIHDNRPRAFVVNRTALDILLADLARDAGVEINLNRRVERLKVSNEYVSGVILDGKVNEARITVDAEGASRMLIKDGGFLKKSGRPLVGVNAEISAGIIDGIVEVWLNNEIAPGFFTWVIPIGGGKARVGLASKRGNVVANLDVFIKKRFNGVDRTKPRTGLVLVNGPLNRTSFNGMVLVGDAAGHVKPTTGGGLVLGGLCAFEAAKVVSRALEEDDLSYGMLMGYDNTWKRLYGSQFSSMLTIRRLMDHLSDERLNRLFSAFLEAGAEDVAFKLIREADMDFQEGVIRHALSNAQLTGILLKGLGGLVIKELKELVNL